MQDKPILVEKSDFICTVTINRPGKHNTLNPDILRELTALFKSLDGDSSVRVVVLRGAGEKSFCAGYDLSLVPAAVEGHSQKMAQGETATPEQDLLDTAVQAISDCPCPVIAMIYGHCIGAGCDVATACDLRLASHTARFAIPAVRRGVIYPPGSIHRIISLVGLSATRELLLTAEFIDAARAKEIGLVNRVVDAKELAEVTYSMARSVAGNSPLAMAATRKAIAKHVQMKRLSPSDEEELQRLAFQCVRSADFQEGLRAFLEKRPPRFQGK